MIESLHVQDREEDLPPSAKKPRIACGQCQVETSKYTCPKCELRTCSLTCSAQHKTERHCDGIRPPFVPVQKFSQFNETTSVKDQEFLHAVQSKVYESKPATSVPPSLPQPASFVPQKQQAVSSPIKQENGATAGSPSVTSSAPQSAPPNAHVAQPSNSNEFSNLTPTEKYLLQNCHRRRVWLTVNSREEADGSRHEQFSDTVYWTIRMKFMRHAGTRITTPNAAPALQGQDSESREDGELDSEAGESELRIAQSDDEDATDGQQEAATNEQDGVAPAAPIEPTDTSIEIKEEPTAQEERDAEAVEEHSYTVKNIPESLTVNTLLRQFVRPKIYGPVISRGDLDADKMAPFIEAGMEHVAMYMRVPVGPNERYYIIDKTKTILENLRNRFVIGHPEFIVTLDNDFMELPTLSESEAQDLQTARREDYKQRMSDKRQHFGGGSDGPGANRGHGPPSFRGGPSFHRGVGGRGGGRGGFRGGRGGFGGDRNRFGAPGGPPRGGHFRGGRGGGGGQPFHGGVRRAPPEIDPFEHFMDTNPRYLRPSDYAPPRNSESDERH